MSLRISAARPLIASLSPPPIIAEFSLSTTTRLDRESTATVYVRVLHWKLSSAATEC